VLIDTNHKESEPASPKAEPRSSEATVPYGPAMAARLCPKPPTERRPQRSVAERPGGVIRGLRAAGQSFAGEGSAGCCGSAGQGRLAKRFLKGVIIYNSKQYLFINLPYISHPQDGTMV